MKQQLQQLILHALTHLQQENTLIVEDAVSIEIERTRDPQFGDYSSNIALKMAKKTGKSPRELASLIIKAIPTDDQLISNIDIAGPGFINFHLTDTAEHDIIGSILSEKEKFGHSNFGQQQKVYLEFVSANPTGPLHVGHGRGAAYGAACGNIMRAIGYDVHQEYYVNDAGRQMNILAVSVWLRYLMHFGATLTFPSNGYRGDYIIDIATSLAKQYGEQFIHPVNTIFDNITADEQQSGEGDKEAHIDDLIKKAQQLLGDTGFSVIHSAGLIAILDDIKQDLKEFGVTFDNWFSERQLLETGALEKSIKQLTLGGHTFTKDGNLWFRATAFGDEKDRVLIRKNGVATYFASDVAYHLHKFEHADQIIDVFGADHHGYVPRIAAFLRALGKDPLKFEAQLVQFAILYRGKEKVQMSTRSGSFVTLRQLRHEVGNDAARFFYVMRKHEQHMDFDLALAKSTSNENPVYYIQYAHARICSVERQLHEKNITWDKHHGLTHLNYLVEPQEKEIVKLLNRYSEVLQNAGAHREPHLIAHYLRELANSLHSYYNALQFIVEDNKLRDARLCLIMATKQIIANGASLLGISAPEKM